VPPEAGEPGRPQEEPAPTRRGKPARPGSAAPAEAPASEETRIKADTFGGTPGHAWYRGFVDLTAGETRIQSDRMDLYETEKPDGGKGRKVVAEGNVVFMRGDERLSGSRMTLDMDTGVGVFEDALGYVQPGVFVEGRTIERLSADTYRIEGAKFTSCAQPDPRWAFGASSARLEVGDKIVAKNVVFRIKQVPAFYLPYIVYPVREDQRSSGLLFPSFGYSSLRGVNVGEAFYWAMGRSFDQTFSVDNYSKYGYGFGHEFRYAAAPPSRGTFQTYVFQPRDGGELDYDLDWQAQQQLPLKLRGSVSVRQYSNLLFQQRVQDSFNLATTRSRRAALNLQRSLGPTNLQLLADSNDTFFSRQTRVNRHLPLLRLSMAPQRLGASGVAFRYDMRAERLENGTKNDADSNRNRLNRYSRFDVNPELSRPISLAFLQLTPQLEGRYTYYSDSLGSNNRPTGASLQRAYFESSLELRGPTFARVFNTPGNFYSEKYKHVIGPEATYRYRSAVEDFSSIPRFDAVDTLRGTNQIQYALVQSLLAKRSGPGGKDTPYEFLTWRVGQTYYVDQASREFDPDYSSNNFEAGGLSNLSPLQSRLKLQPTPRLRTSFDLEYDLQQSLVRSLSLGANLSGERGDMQVSWSRSAEQTRNNRRIPPRSSVRGSLRLEVLPERLSLDVQADYDFVSNTMVHSTGRLRYDVQCCGFLAEVIRYDFNERVEQQFRFSIELANIGSFGNFNGEERGQPQRLGGSSFK